MRPEQGNLARAGSLIAAAWFELCGWCVSWPLEPCRYDLLISKEATNHRVQVKTTTVKQGTSWTVWISSTGKTRTTYDHEEIDYFFIIDGDFDYYLIPVATVGGLTAVQLSAYREYRLAREVRRGPAEITDPTMCES